MTSGAGATITYDEANRISTATEVSGGREYYGYDASNKRVYRVTASGQEQIIFYGLRGEKLGVYNIQEGTNCNYGYMSGYGGAGPCISGLPAVNTSIWFGSRLIMDSSGGAFQDRVGTNRASGARFYPYGDEITSTSNDREKFGTYTRDSYTGLDYADQRFYASTYGRFNTPDPYAAGGASSGSSSNPSDPGSWNRYAYTRGDPVNRADPLGLEDCDTAYALIEGCTGDPLDYCSGNGTDPECIGAPASGGGSVCDTDPTILALRDPGTYQACLGISPPATMAPPELCPLVGITGNYSLGQPNKVGDPVHPIFSPTTAFDLDAAIALMNSQKIDPTITDGFRTLADQINVNSGNNPKAGPGQSWHEIGVAVDFSVSSLSSQQFLNVVQDMLLEGFTWGGSFTNFDVVHFQLAPANYHANGTVTSGVPSMLQVQNCQNEHPTGFY